MYTTSRCPQIWGGMAFAGAALTLPSVNARGAYTTTSINELKPEGFDAGCGVGSFSILFIEVRRSRCNHGERRKASMRKRANCSRMGYNKVIN